MMRRLAVVWAIVLGGCVDDAPSVGLVFPDEPTRAATDRIDVWTSRVSASLLVDPSRSVCDPDPDPADHLARWSLPFGPGGQERVDLPVPAGSVDTPGGVFVVRVDAVVEARPDAPLASGCACLHVEDEAPSAAVAAQCRPLSGWSELILRPTAPPDLRLTACGGERFATTPGPEARVVVCVRGPACDPLAGEAESTRCGSDPWPVFLGTEPAGPAPRLVWLGTSWHAVDVQTPAGEGPFRVKAFLPGRADQALNLRVDRVSPAPPAVRRATLTVGAEEWFRGLARLPDPGGDADRLLVVTGEDERTLLRAVDPIGLRPALEADIQGLVTGFVVLDAAPPGEPPDPMVAVAVHAAPDSRPPASVFVLSPTSVGFEPRVVLERPCDDWGCGSRAPCAGPTCPEGERCDPGRGLCILEGPRGADCSQGPAGCGCRLEGWTTLAAGDVDGDGRADLLAAAGETVSIWPASSQREARFEEGRCRCSLHADRQVTGLAVAGLGGPAEAPALYLRSRPTEGTPRGDVVYATSPRRPVVYGCAPRPEIPLLEPFVRFTTGRFGCGVDPGDCRSGQDLVLVSEEEAWLVFGGETPLGAWTALDRGPGVSRPIFGPVVPDLAFDRRRGAPQVGDLDGDGHQDLVLWAWATIDGRRGSVVSAWLGQATGALAPSLILSPQAFADCPSRSGTEDLALADLDGDGRDEVAAACSASGEVRIFGAR